MPGSSVGTLGVVREQMEVWWRMLRALRASTDGMRAAGAEYLPPDWMERQNPHNDPKKPSYAERLKRSFLLEAYDDTIARLAAKPFQRAIQVGEGLPAPLDLIEDDADLSGTSLTLFASQLLDSLADRGIALFIVDRPQIQPRQVFDEQGNPVVDTTGRPMTEVPKLSLAEEDAEGIRPYFAHILPDNIVGWQAETTNGRDNVTELRVRETAYRYEADYSETTLDRIRVWKATTWELWEKPVANNSTDPNVRLRIQSEERLGHVQVVKPTPHNFPGNRIPMVVVYAQKLGPLHARPPLLRLAWLNVHHWQSGSQQSWILHYARAPILMGKGMTREEVERGISLGAGASALSSNDHFDLRYVEPGGSSLEAGRLDLESIEGRMHALGMAPIVEVQGPTTATGEVRADQRQQSDLQKWVESLEWGLIQGYELAAEWSGVALPADWTLSIWRDFGIVARGQQDLQTLDTARSRRDISQQTYLEEIQLRGVLQRDRDIEDEVEKSSGEQQELADRRMAELEVAMRSNGQAEQQDEPQEDSEDDSDQRPPARRFPAS